MTSADIGDSVYILSDANCFTTAASWEYFEEKLKPAIGSPRWFRGIIHSRATGIVVSKFLHEKRADKKQVFVVELRDGSMVAVDAEGIEVHISRGTEVQLFPRRELKNFREKLTKIDGYNLVPLEKCVRCGGTVEKVLAAGSSFAYLVRLGDANVYTVAQIAELAKRSNRRKCRRFGEDDVAFIESTPTQLHYSPLGMGSIQFCGSYASDANYVHRILTAVQVTRPPYLSRFYPLDDSKFDY